MRIELVVEAESYDVHMTLNEFANEASSALEEALDAMGYRDVTVSVTT